jgi:hypothetical protein
MVRNSGRSGTNLRPFNPFESFGRVGRRLLIALSVAGALALPPVVALADGLTAVNVDCGDGYPMSATVNLADLTKIQNAVQAMVLYPAGLSCTLSTNAVLDPTASATTGQGSATGGGRYVSPVDGCVVNFGLSAHNESSGTHGTSNLTQPGTCSAGTGHVTSKVQCLFVDMVKHTARLAGPVTQVDGYYTGSPLFINQGDIFVTDVTDGQNGAPDQIIHFAQSSAGFSCSLVNQAPGGSQNLVNGNINVRG